MPTVQIEMSDQSFQDMACRAEAAGYPSVTEYLTDVVQLDYVLGVGPDEATGVGDRPIFPLDEKIQRGLDSLGQGRGVDGEAYFDRLEAELGSLDLDDEP